MLNSIYKHYVNLQFSVRKLLYMHPFLFCQYNCNSVFPYIAHSKSHLINMWNGIIFFFQDAKFLLFLCFITLQQQ